MAARLSAFCVPCCVPALRLAFWRSETTIRDLEHNRALDTSYVPRSVSGPSAFCGTRRSGKQAGVL
eukprot:11184996-Lingulodinium_polyedra.AAC.1